jgi:enolase-phosphatase E1
MKIQHVTVVLTDIEGTTSSVRFVYDTLFPYFRKNCWKLKELTHLPSVQQAFKRTVELAYNLDGLRLRTVEDILSTLLRWSEEDRKITPLKTLQGILWKEGYEKGELQGHVYPDVAQALEQWAQAGLTLAVFSSGSVAAQKLLFEHSVSGDLTRYFSAYFDTETGEKRAIETYQIIAEQLSVNPSNILFLSDIKEELEAASCAGMQTIQLIRPGTDANWPLTVFNFAELAIDKK